ncbi:hypothetical protein GCM10019059_25800 [Camelimonas fluminis]|nr:hypothetical protein GCM10019059_25800 [Camelimonas fluminis]
MGTQPLARNTAIPGLSASGATRSALIVLAMALALAGCGRRGALQAPPNAAQQTQTDGQRTGAVVGDDEDDGNDSVVASPIPGGQKKSPKGITIPKRPFILDPLL